MAREREELWARRFREAVLVEMFLDSHAPSRIIPGLSRGEAVLYTYWAWQSATATLRALTGQED